MSRLKNRRTWDVGRGTKAEPFVWIEVDLERLRSNFRILRATARRSGADILAVVKADAYGHGMTEVSKALFREGARFFGVATLEEALRLQKTCPKAKVLVLGSFRADQIPVYARTGIRPTLSSIEDLRVFEKALARRRSTLSLSKEYPVHVKIDTGMGRLGVWHSEALELFEALGASKKIELEGVYTHFSSADDTEDFFTKLQLHRFKAILEKLEAIGLKPRYAHAANSLGLARFRQSHLNLVRPGLLLYGLNPGKNWKPPASLKPVLSLKARISFLKEVDAERPLSYGRTYQTQKATRIATLPIGYSHGYRVAFSNRGSVVVRGQRCPVVGRVTMDQTLVDVGLVPGVKRWDVATLLGQDGKNSVSAEELAALLGTIPYEIVCALHSRIPRVYKGLK